MLKSSTNWPHCPHTSLIHISLLMLPRPSWQTLWLNEAFRGRGCNRKTNEKLHSPHQTVCHVILTLLFGWAAGQHCQVQKKMRHSNKYTLVKGALISKWKNIYSKKEWEMRHNFKMYAKPKRAQHNSISLPPTPPCKVVATALLISLDTLAQRSQFFALQSQCRVLLSLKNLIWNKWTKYA